MNNPTAELKKIEELARSAGADQYTPKPADPYELCDRVEQLLNQK